MRIERILCGDVKGGRSGKRLQSRIQQANSREKKVTFFKKKKKGKKEADQRPEVEEKLKAVGQTKKEITLIKPGEI